MFGCCCVMNNQQHPKGMWVLDMLYLKLLAAEAVSFLVAIALQLQDGQ
jgi:hypothetical protein